MRILIEVNKLMGRQAARRTAIVAPAVDAALAAVNGANRIRVIEMEVVRYIMW